MNAGIPVAVEGVSALPSHTAGVVQDVPVLRSPKTTLRNAPNPFSASERLCAVSPWFSTWGPRHRTRSSTIEPIGGTHQ
jgi:hypothetical protein